MIPQNCKIQYRKILKKYCTLRICRVVLCWHASLLLVSSTCPGSHAVNVHAHTHMHTHMHTSHQHLPQQPCQHITKPFIESCSHESRSATDVYAISYSLKDKDILISHHSGSNRRAWTFSPTQPSVFILSHAKLSWAARPLLGWLCLPQLCRQRVSRAQLS